MTDAMARGRDGVVVLGAHRSGTSLTAGLLAHAGLVDAAEGDTMAVQPDNPRGYFERLSLTGWHDDALASLGGHWSAPALPSAIAGAAPTLRTSAADLLARIVEEARPREIVVKDPRMCLFLPVWLPVLGDRFDVVMTVRNPLDVAASLAARDGFSPTVGLALWEVHVAALAEGLRGRRVYVAPLDSIGTAGGAGRLVHDLTGPTSAPDTSLLDPALVHHAAESDEAVPLLTRTQSELWAWLRELPQGWTVADPPSVSAEAQSYRLLADRLRATEHLATTRAELVTARNNLADANTHIDQLIARCRELEAEVESLRHRIAELEAGDAAGSA